VVDFLEDSTTSLAIGVKNLPSIEMKDVAATVFEGPTNCQHFPFAVHGNEELSLMEDASSGCAR